jgi:hypothetical protein
MMQLLTQIHLTTSSDVVQSEALVQAALRAHHEPTIRNACYTPRHVHQERVELSETLIGK